ncbi:hypothetical protein F4861DRAFT_551039 [Xylaria intraflava]|nr:hypothetical protein F4861DRAFT_551039 [Xylaria intraflava]
MNNYLDDRDFYDQGGFYVGDHHDSSEWAVSPGSGTCMTREPSGESMATAHSSDMMRTPSLEYGLVWSPMPDSSHGTNSLPTGYDPSYMSENSERVIAGGGNYDNLANESDRWWEFYDFVADVEHGQPPYWKLKSQITPSFRYPPIRVGVEHGTVPQSQINDGMFVCLAKNCSKSFKRKADLERHYKNLHTLSECKDQYPCDWKRCQRAKAPFHRLDHQREHYREFHHEDIMRRGSSGKQDEEWWSTRAIHPSWWRCSRCLCRVRIEAYGYECPECKTSCETERISYRMARGPSL